MVITWRAARIRNKLTGLRGICTRAIERVLDDGQGAEMSPDQWLEMLLPVIADNVHAIDGEADHDAERQARPRRRRDPVGQGGDRLHRGGSLARGQLQKLDIGACELAGESASRHA